jgi:3'(2'), 5'-bisphosphate nucleotidase
VFTNYSDEAAFALLAVRRAAELCRVIQGEMVTPAISKSDHSPVTVADYASQAVVAKLLVEHYPHDALVAEEDSQVLRDAGRANTLSAVTGYVRRVFKGISTDQVCRWIDHGAGGPGDRFWTCDPIDGTKGFLRGDQYVVALALIANGEVVVAALGCPNLSAGMKADVNGSGSAVIAVRGEGAWSMPLHDGSPNRLHVSSVGTPHEARVLRSFESGHTDSAKIASLLETLGIKADPVLMDSQAKYALLAAGSGELLFRLLSPARPDYREKIWDQAAGSLIVEEAGGRVTDLRGKALDFTQGRQLEGNFGVLASNGCLHQAALDAIRSAGADQRPEPA